MDWSPDSARNAYLDTVKLCNRQEHNHSCSTTEPESKEFISALAAGMNAKLIVEVTPDASSSTIALAAAARQTGGKFVCILPEPRLDASQKVIDNSGLNDMVEFKTGNPIDILQNYENIDFSLVDCKSDNYTNFLEVLDVNPTGSVVVADNLVDGRKGLEGHVKGIMENEGKVRSMKHPIGKGMEVTTIGKSNEPMGKRNQSKSSYYARARGGSGRKGGCKSRWVIKVDEKSGEEHIFRRI